VKIFFGVPNIINDTRFLFSQVVEFLIDSAFSYLQSWDTVQQRPLLRLTSPPAKSLNLHILKSSAQKSRDMGARRFFCYHVSMDINDKVVIVTGASSGIGLATARLLAEHGAKVALVARSQEKLKHLSKEIPDSLAIRADMTKEADIIQMVKKTKDHYGRVDVLINAAGQGYDAPVEKINIDTYRQIFDLDVVGPLVAMQQVIPIMRDQKEGTIVNISSGTALMYLPDMSPYSSIKSALASLSLTAREELKKDNITVSVVYPYMTLTEFEKNTIKDIEETQAEPEEDRGELPPLDPPEHVARKILEGIENDEAEIFAHDWMRKSRQA
jgi:short-subunit dehydrogenase